MRDKTIDIWKGICIIAIMICHASQPITTLNKVLKIGCDFGQLGCQIFFYFTGYLFFLKHKNTRERAFVKRKIYGIIIPWYLAIIIYTAISTIGMKSENLYFYTNNKILPIIINLLFLNGAVPFANNNVVPGGWYVGTLVLIWYISPLILRKNDRNNFNNYLVSLIFVCWFCMVIYSIILGYKSVSRNSFAYFSIFNQLPCFLYGILVANMEPRRVNRSIIVSILLTLLIGGMFVFKIRYSAIIYPILVCIVFEKIWRMSTNFIKKNVDSTILKYLSWCGRNSLYIYLSHIIFVWYIEYAVWKKLNILNGNIFFIFIIVICLLIVPVMAFAYKALCDEIYMLIRKLSISNYVYK